MITTYLLGIAVSITLAALIGLPAFLRERQRRRLAEAKLNMSRIVTRMEELMLSGDFEDGEVCHDHVFKVMVRLQSARKYEMHWNFLHIPSRKELLFRRHLHSEISRKGTEVAELIANFGMNAFSAYRYRHPLAFYFFILRGLIFFGGLRLIIKGVWHYQNLRENWNRFKAEWTMANSYSQLVGA